MAHRPLTHRTNLVLFVKIEIAHSVSFLGPRQRQLDEGHLCRADGPGLLSSGSPRLVTVRALLRKTLSSPSVHVKLSCTGCNGAKCCGVICPALTDRHDENMENLDFVTYREAPFHHILKLHTFHETWEVLLKNIFLFTSSAVVYCIVYTACIVQYRQLH